MTTLSLESMRERIQNERGELSAIVEQITILIASHPATANHYYAALESLGAHDAYLQGKLAEIEYELTR